MEWVELATREADDDCLDREGLEESLMDETDDW